LFDLVMAIIFVLFFVTVDDTSPFFFREREWMSLRLRILVM
jgi:hypothetical protein